MNNYNDIKEVVNKEISKKKKVSLLIGFVIVLLLLMYFTQPIFSFKYLSTFRFAIILLAIFASIITSKRTKVISVAVVLYVITILLGIFSSPIFHSQDYYELLGDVNEYNYSETQPDINSEMIPIVDQALAEQLGDKVLGEDIGLGSQYEIGEYNLITTPDDIVWVAPLEPRSFFKWFQNREGSPGYIYVSATDLNDIRLVKDIDGEDINMKYTNKSYFFNQIDRHVYFEGYMFNEKTDYSFEIDDEGNPYWVITLYEPQIVYSGYDTTGVIVVDAQTGETTAYDNLEDAPEWIERIHPEEFISEQIDDYGLYENGWINTIFAQENVITQTEGNSYVYIDDNPYYYSGLTSITNDESTVGFMLVNLRTKESDFYKITGATETAAQSSAEGQVQQYGYSASFPILLNEFGVPSYFMTLKDQDGLLKQYAFVSVSNYNIVGVGNSIDQARNNYFEQLQDSNQIEEVEIEEIGATNLTVDRINYVDNNYYLVFEGDSNIYRAEESISNELVVTQPDDKVDITYAEGDGDYIEIYSFDNLAFGGSDE